MSCWAILVAQQLKPYTEEVRNAASALATCDKTAGSCVARARNFGRW